MALPEGRAATRRLPPWAYGAVAAAVTLAAIAVVGLGLLGGSDEPALRADVDAAAAGNAEPGDGASAPGAREGRGAGEDGEDGEDGPGGSAGSGRSGAGAEGGAGAAAPGQAGAGATTTTQPVGGGGAAGPGGGASPTATSGPGGSGASTTVPVTEPEEIDPAISEAFTQGFEARCREIWSLSMDGQLYDPEDRSSPYVVEDCLEQVDPDFAESYSSEAEAAEGGREEADFAAYLLTISGQLCYAGECWTYE